MTSLRRDELDRLEPCLHCLARSFENMPNKGEKSDCLQRGTSMAFSLFSRRFTIASLYPLASSHTSINRQ
jgi:hypothetical protein